MSLPITAGSPLEYYPPTHPTPDFPANKRMFLTGLYYQLGEWLDYYTGDHTLSRRLRELRSLPAPPGVEPYWALDPIKAREVIGEKNIRLFPQFGVAENWPPTMSIHGSEDRHVPLRESEHLAVNLTAMGVENELVVVEGQAHAFDNAPDAEREFGRLFDRAVAFLIRNLRK
jgi:acetyl esterase/lipase